VNLFLNYGQIAMVTSSCNEMMKIYNCISLKVHAIVESG